MRVALLLSGELRDSIESYKLLKENLLDIYNPDVFISTWENLVPIKNTRLKTLPPENDTDYRELMRMYNPINFEVEDYSSGFEEIWNQKTQQNFHKLETNANLISIISMWYKTMRVTQLKSNYESLMGFKYDIVIKSRPDLKLHEPIHLFPPYENTLYIPKGWDWSGGWNDLFAFGGSEVMDIYGNIFNGLVDVTNRMHRINPERFLRRYIQTQTNLELERPKISISLRGMRIEDTYSWC